MQVISNSLFPPGLNSYTERGTKSSGTGLRGVKHNPNVNSYVDMLLFNVVNETSCPTWLISGVEIRYEEKYFFAPDT